MKVKKSLKVMENLRVDLKLKKVMVGMKVLKVKITTTVYMKKKSQILKEKKVEKEILMMEIHQTKNSRKE